jgi:hypothetical protein
VELVTDASKLIDRWPVLAQQLHRALISADEDELATQVNELRIVEMCGCGDDFCQSFYTEPPPSGAFPEGSYNVSCGEPGWEGYLILDIVGGQIAYVEVLDRPPLD